MATTPPSGMIGRIKAILIEPKNEFQRIDAEPATVSGIMTGWVAPLAAIGPLALLIGGLTVGYSAFGVTYRPSVAAAVGQAVISYVLALVAAYVCSLVIDALATSFGGQKNPVQALKTYAYAMTAAYLAGIFAIIPMLGILGIVGLYSGYLLFVALPIMMKSPPDKTVGYFVVTILVAIVVMWVVSWLAGMALAMFMPAVPIGSINLR